MANSNQQNGTTTLQLMLAWGFVGIPLAWGVAQTIARMGGRLRGLIHTRFDG